MIGEQTIYESCLTIDTEELQAAHPKLHHYTDLGGLNGIVGTNTIRATHFGDLNDSTEARLLKEPLVDAVTVRFKKRLIAKHRVSLRIRRDIEKSGGIDEVARTTARHFINALYDVTIDRPGELSFAEPYIASFCTHAANSYEERHGLLSQWRGYGGDGGFCLVLDTRRLAEMLGREFDSHYYLHSSLAAAIYADETVSVDASFPTLLDCCDYFLAESLEGNSARKAIEDGFVPFVEGATRFKHQGFREESEIRIVAVPGTAYVAERVRKEYPDQFKPPPIKPVRTSQHSKPKRFISLFEGLNEPLPILRVIVGPSTHQSTNVERAIAIVGGIIPVVPSDTPFIGQGKPRA
jgi:hypothetical protein